MWNDVLITAGVVFAISLLLGVLLALFIRFFGIEDDEKVKKIKGALPGANCGACGYKGCADYAEALRRLYGRVKFDIVFLDPPYNKGLVSAALKLLCQYDLLKPTSVIVCESGGEDILSGGAQGKYEVIKTAKYGIASVTLLKPTCITNE